MSVKIISLRPTLPDDRDFCFNLFSVVKLEELQASHWDEAMLTHMMRMQFAAHEQHHRRAQKAVSDSIVVAEPRRGAPQTIGRMIVGRGEVLHLADLSLLPEFRNLGYGQRLMGELQAEAVAKKLPLQLQCRPSNRALSLYLRLGFVVIDSQPSHLLLEWRPVSSQSRHLTDPCGPMESIL
ncbi:GNAT family N-acetyltransferase [Hydrogenophaga soli]